MADIEEANNQNPYTPLLDDQETQKSLKRKSRNVLIVTGILILCVSLGLIINFRSDHQISPRLETEKSVIIPETAVVSRGVSHGVSEKASRLFSSDGVYPWTNEMLSWQRTAFHFQPEQNWMNDPNGPLFYKGWYHFFYQYNPNGAVWGNIVWGHAVSRDMINWFHLPIAMVADNWYDANGVWTGSATFLADGSIVMLYTGSTNEHVQVQNLAYPANLSDPLLLEWVKYSGNPVLVPPPGIDDEDFRDPTTAWIAPDGNWRITIGSKLNTTGVSLVYETKNFINYTLVDGLLHAVPGTGMWECIDFYPVSLTASNGLDTSVNGPEVKHVMKTSLVDDNNDYYALGTYDLEKNVWKPDNPVLDVGVALRYDYGIFYASKTFYDQNKQRRILWSWITETDSEIADVKKGWASVQAIPRTVYLDEKTKTNLIQWPVAEIESLRTNKKMFNNIKLEAGSVVPLEVGNASQLDITAEFEVERAALEGIMATNDEYNCSTSKGASGKSALGPFGLLVLADDDQSEQTAIYFYITKGTNGKMKTSFCSDETRSSRATNVRKQIYGSTVPVLDNEKLSVRILVDHSIVESFAQGGRTCITSRVYPTQAIDGAARVFLFSNATSSGIIASKVNIWEMKPASILPYPDSLKA
ncbi:beta-fructofuranosidase [Ranunculus cassubicifolius]